MDPANNENQPPNQTAARSIEKAVEAIAVALDLRLDKRPLRRVSDQPRSSKELIDHLVEVAMESGIILRPTEYVSSAETFAAVRQGYAIAFLIDGRRWLVAQHRVGKRLDVIVIDDDQVHEEVSQEQLDRMLGKAETFQMLVAKKEMECETLSVTNPDLPSKHHHPSPLQRFIALLKLDRHDIGLVVLFAGVAGVLGLATPLVIESLVNVVSWGIYFQPLLVLSAMLLVCLGIAGILKVLQTWVVELIQRRQFVRIVGDLAHRFPRAGRAQMQGIYPRELANRVFDIMTIQKASAILLLDGITIVLTTILGLILLAFYHPFLLGFDLVLIVTMVILTWVLGRGGISTAIEESKTKYAVAHWLQDVISMPTAFKIGGGEQLAVLRANQLTSEYVKARKRQFGVVIRQVIFAVSLQVLASTALLGLGGWLVIEGELTLGQLIASELVVTVVVGAFAKAGKSLEKFYDLMAGIDKVGHMLDLNYDPRGDIGQFPEGPLAVSWTDVVFKSATSQSKLSATQIDAGKIVALNGEHPFGASELLKAIAGLTRPQQGAAQIDSFDAFESALAYPGELVGFVNGDPEIFHGTIGENVALGRPTISPNAIREALKAVGLHELILGLPAGIDTRLQTTGMPFNSVQVLKLAIARAIVGRPPVLLFDHVFERLPLDDRQSILDYLKSDAVRATILIATQASEVADRCDSRVSVHR
ncbi:ATP-binding cassette domain-containing protein [Roseiconus lacunae]|uniref:ATP-binding cassette domain-containing protein n=1 Tax=Roseiconus lacunae TaxID=2605694 RepID=A0ABT7PCS4_9BACT|nr:ATP-binding cassette domain-containing protein [Roseiconus lacunae]MCD0459596.1 ATP-binding cassette domain-containing protein [Roseiconus lacunae]MDM4014294.1 ATP-binding cassette domain-containing protein [Roseiconus lacunae]WRQ49612.1 ATP-binding cassette domain-containing protein [Stieleria sp. HD01]